MFNKIKTKIYSYIIYYKLGLLWVWYTRRKDAESILKTMTDSTCFRQGGKTVASSIVFTYHLIMADKAYKKVLALTKDIEAKYSCLSRDDKARVTKCILSTTDSKI
jgi:hypothetical protein